mmetsp:Transcript_16700/g.23212  ORF Transcript_16700/g.23212 Transcript_16700/m.23212 type:complete len:125 (+) Transcript_16700:1322-1696(+)
MTKITDFGLSRICEGAVYNASASSVFPVRWSAREVLAQKKISKAADVWSFGITLWEMIEGQEPYFELSSNEVVKAVTRGFGSPTTLLIPDRLWTSCLCVGMLSQKDRPSTLYVKYFKTLRGSTK